MSARTTLPDAIGERSAPPSNRAACSAAAAKIMGKVEDYWEGPAGRESHFYCKSCTHVVAILSCSHIVK